MLLWHDQSLSFNLINVMSYEQILSVPDLRLVYRQRVLNNILMNGNDLKPTTLCPATVKMSGI